MDDHEDHNIVLPSGEPASEQDPPKKKKSRWGWLTSFGGLLFVFKASKLWVIIKGMFIFLKFGKFITTGLSMMLMIITYTYIYGWK